MAVIDISFDPLLLNGKCIATNDNYGKTHEIWNWIEIIELKVQVIYPLQNLSFINYLEMAFQNSKMNYEED